MQEDFFPKEVGEYDEYPGEDGKKMGLEGLYHAFGCTAAVNIGGNELEG